VIESCIALSISIVHHTLIINISLKYDIRYLSDWKCGYNTSVRSSFENIALYWLSLIY